MPDNNMLSNEITIQVVDQNGERQDEQVLVNVPWLELLGEIEKVTFIDWMAADGKRPTMEELEVPVSFAGDSYNGALAWGSAVKRGVSIGLTRDIGVECGMFDFVEDAMRLKRWLLAEGTYGGVVGKQRIAIVKAGTVVSGKHPVEDGFGLISRSMAESGYNGHAKIKLGKSRDAVQFTQRFPPTPEILEAVMPLVKKRMEVLEDPGTRSIFSATFLQEKREWIELESKMVHHPYIANALDRMSSDTYARAAATIPTNSDVWVAVPSTVRQVATTEQKIVFRYPIDSWGGIQAVNEEGSETELKRVSDMEVIQFSISSLDFFASGIFGVVEDDDMPSGCDIVICADDIKLRKGNPNHRRRCGVIDFEGVVTFTQWYAPGCAIGIGYKWFSACMGGDFDGDLVVGFSHENCAAFDVLYSAVREFPKQKTEKLKKSKASLAKDDKRVDMLWNNMVNLVGFASNMAASSFMVTEREELARALGFSSVDDMDGYFNWAIKAGTDGYKSSILFREVNGSIVPVTLKEIEDNLGRLQSTFLKMMGGLAPWNSWLRHDVFFRHTVPMVVEGMRENGMYQVSGYTQPIFLQKADMKAAVRPLHNSLVAEIARATLPALAGMLDSQIKVHPLAYFKNWANKVDDEEFKLAKEQYVNWFTYNSRRVNWADGSDAQAFKNRCRIRFLNFCRESEMSEEVALNAIWQAAHTARGKMAGAAAAFLAHPEMAKEIVSAKPGLNGDKITATLVGLSHNLESPFAHWSGQVVIEEITVTKNRKELKRMIIKPVNAASFVFKAKPASSQYPADMFGLVSAQSGGMPAGVYQAKISADTARSHVVVLQ